MQVEKNRMAGPFSPYTIGHLTNSCKSESRRELIRDSFILFSLLFDALSQNSMTKEQMHALNSSSSHKQYFTKLSHQRMVANAACTHSSASVSFSSFLDVLFSGVLTHFLLFLWKLKYSQNPDFLLQAQLASRDIRVLCLSYIVQMYACKVCQTKTF